MEDKVNEMHGSLADALATVTATSRDLEDAKEAHLRAVSDAHRKGASLR